VWTLERDACLLSVWNHLSELHNSSPFSLLHSQFKQAFQVSSPLSSLLSPLSSLLSPLSSLLSPPLSSPLLSSPHVCLSTSFARPTGAGAHPAAVRRLEVSLSAAAHRPSQCADTVQQRSGRAAALHRSRPSAHLLPLEPLRSPLHSQRCCATRGEERRGEERRREKRRGEERRGEERRGHRHTSADMHRHIHSSGTEEREREV